MGNPSNGPAVVKWLNIFVPTWKDCHLVTSGHRWSQYYPLTSRPSIMMALMITISLCNLVTLVTPGHIWSQVVSIISVDIKDLKNDGLDDYYFSL